MAMGAVVAVTGATGKQGGAVVNALLADERKHYTVRAISRDPSSPKAKALADRGVEVVEGDLSNKDSLVKAFTEAASAFIITDFLSAKTPEKEIQQGRNAVDAAKEAGVKFVVFSTLEDLPQDVKSALPRLENGYTVPHFEAKANVQEYLKQSGVPHASLLTSAFFENFLGGLGPRKQEDGSFVFSTNLDTAPHAWHSVIDIGGATAEILADPSEHEGKTIPVNSGYISNDECAKIYSTVTGKKVRYHEITDEQMALLPFPIARELANMYTYLRRFPCYDELREPSKCIFAGPSFAGWAEQNADALKEQLQG